MGLFILLLNSFFKNFSDKRVKLLILKYQKSSHNSQIYEKILKLVSPYVYNYAFIRFKLDKDYSSDFYLYFFERFSKLILKNYKIQNSLFVTWLNKVLKTHFSNWKKQKSMVLDQEYHKITLILDDMETSSFSLIKGKTAKLKDLIFLNNHQKNQLWNIEDAQKLLLEMPQKLKCIIKLVCPDLILTKDLQEIGEVFNLPLDKVFAGYQFLLQKNLNKYRKKYSTFNGLLKLNYEIIKYEYKLNQMKESFLNLEEDTYKNGLLKLNLLKKRKLRKIYDYHRIVIQSKIEDIAFILNLRYQHVKNLVYRAKVKLKDIIIENSNKGTKD